MAGVLSLKTPSTGLVTLTPTDTATNKTITIPATTGSLVVQDATNTTSVTNLAYTGTLTGGTGVVAIGTNQIYKDASGNVGIGTASPSQKLDVAGGSIAASNFFTPITAGTVGTSTTSVVTYGSTGAGGVTNTLALNTNSIERMRIDPSGNVGIGTINPSALRVTIEGNSGQLRIRNTTTRYRSDYLVNSGGETNINSYDDTGGVFLPLSLTSSILAISRGASETARFQANGDVGIGTVSNIASSKLDVRGRIRTGSGNSSGDAEVIWSNYASATNAWAMSVRQDVGGTNNDLKFLRFDSSGNYQGVAVQITTSGGFLINQVPGQYTIDTTNGITTIANGGTVNFPIASGMLLVNNHSSGAVTLYACGGGSTSVIGGVGAMVGTFAYNSGIAGYTWTNNYGSSAVFGFMFFRTRTTA